MDLYAVLLASAVLALGVAAVLLSAPARARRPVRVRAHAAYRDPDALRREPPPAACGR